MKILWITNIIFPDVCKQKGMVQPVIGGWMYALAKALLEQVDAGFSLAVATTYRGDKIEKYFLNGIIYYLVPTNVSMTKYNKRLEKFWVDVNDDFRPDIVHLHGTEYAHGLAFLKACPDVKSVVSIQGLVSVCAKYYLADLNFKDILRNISLRDIIRMDTLWHQKNNFAKRGNIEKEILKSVKHVIGRTSWDRAHVLAINPLVNYHHCNEILRSEFYKHIWSYNECEKHSIFLSQALYPIKGLHKVLKAIPLVLDKYPDLRVYIAGNNIIKTDSLMAKLKMTGYAKYIKHLIKSLNLKAYINFLGPLDEEEMCKQYLKANLFVLPSSIENSPNSLGEAQLLGVPCLSSYVGGVMDMMEGAEDWMYRFEETEMLAMKICAIFNLESVYPTKHMQVLARMRHDKEVNTYCLKKIYDNIVNS